MAESPLESDPCQGDDQILSIVASSPERAPSSAQGSTLWCECMCYMIPGKMNTTVYLIRHGDIECADRIPGRMTGMHLSDHGKKQARNLIEFFKDRDLDAIYSSPMDRAVETASVLAEEKKLQIQICDAFNEIDFGDWTNKRFSELESDFGWKQFHFSETEPLFLMGS